MTLLPCLARRRLPVAEPKPMTRLRQLRWFLPRGSQRVPPEKYELPKACHRGIKPGWQPAPGSIKSFVKF